MVYSFKVNKRIKKILHVLSILNNVLRNLCKIVVNVKSIFFLYNKIFNWPVFFLFQIKMVGTRVYVGGLSYRVGERDLDRFFRSYGRLRDIVIKNGFGFVVRI